MVGEEEEGEGAPADRGRLASTDGQICPAIPSSFLLCLGTLLLRLPPSSFQLPSSCYSWGCSSRTRTGYADSVSPFLQSNELAASYAALILADEGIEISSEKLLTLTSAAKVELEPIWATLLAKALEGKNIKELLSNVGSGSGGEPSLLLSSSRASLMC